MRLLQIAGSFAPARIGGPSVVAERVAAELARRDHQVVVLTSGCDRTVRYNSRGLPVLAVAAADVSRVVPEVLRVLRPDVVHAHSARSIGPAPLRLAQQAGCPTVVSRYGAEPPLPPELLRAAGAVVADTPDGQGARVIPIGAAAPEAGWQRSVRTGPLRLGFMGGPAPDQGLGQLIEALTRLRRSDYVVRVVDRASLLGLREIRERDVHVPGLVRIVPAFDPWQAGTFYGSIDALVSLPQSPGHVNIAVRDAMAHGVWPIATDIPANVACIRPGVTGDLVPVGSVDALMAAIDGVLERPEGPPAGLSRELPTVADQVTALEALYASLLAP